MTGGIDLAAEWAGFTTVAFCEQDKFCQKVLAKHWPGVPIFNDVRTLTSESLRGRGIDPESISLVSGGFPCQDVSIANHNGEGLDGKRSGLWREMYRVICELQPRFVLVENVANLARRGLGRVLGDLSEAGLNAEWRTISAAEQGAPHLRERTFIVAYSDRANGFELRTASHDESLPQDFAWWRGRLDELGSSVGVQWCDSYAGIVRAFHGIPRRVDRLRALGNAVVPQQVYPILKAIADYELSNIPAPSNSIRGST